MIDTVVLIIQEGYYKILNPDLFTPNAGILNNPISFGARAFVKCMQNPTKEDYAKGIYKPRLTITKRAVKGGFIKPLKVEFSAPKLLFLNNVNELEENDFEKLLDILQKRLLEMGVEVSETNLKLAKASTIHYSKNIELPDFVVSSMFIRELSKVDITKRLSLDKTFFKNSGHALAFYAKSYAIVIYDKLKDIQQNTGVKIDDDPTIMQQNLFSDNKPQTEILRIEIRLNHSKKIESVLKTIGKAQDRSFINLFKVDIAKKVVLYYWDLMTANKNTFLFSQERDMDKIAEEIYRANPKISAQKLFAIIGYVVFSKEKGTRILRQFVESKYTKRTWLRLNAYSKILGSSTSQIKIWVDVRNLIEEFKPVKPVDTGGKMINNDKDS